MVERINLSNNTWKAENYRFYEGLSIFDLNKLAGINRTSSLVYGNKILEDWQRESDPKILN